MAENTPIEIIENKVYVIRGQKVMLDKDLAWLYNVETRILNQAVKRNPERFPEDFMFQLTQEEYENLKIQNGTSNLKSQFVTSKKESSLISQIVISKKGGDRKLPYAFTEHGVAMLSSVYASPLAGEADFQRERKPANVRKAGEGFRNKRKPFHPHPIFLTLILRVEKSPPPSRERGGERLLLRHLKLLFERCNKTCYNRF